MMMVVGAAAAAPAPPPPPLGVAIVHSAIDEACRRATTAAAAAAGSPSSSPRGAGGRAPVLFRRAIQEDFDTAGALLLGRGSSKEQEGLLFGVVSSYYSSSNSILTTFYFAYSTWDGRVLYLDQAGAHLQDETSSSVLLDEKQRQQQHSLAVRRLLADIAVRCHCSRLTWQHFKKDPQASLISHPPRPSQGVAPETLHGWLTLHWSRDAMQRFLGERQHAAYSSTSINATTTTTQQQQQPSSSIAPGEDGAVDKRTTPTTATATTTVRQEIEACLSRQQPQQQQQQQQQQHPTSFRLRLATSDDLEAMGRLVQGLADFEKEPDAVHVTLDHYRVDGFHDTSRTDDGDGDDDARTTANPLFYCLLLDTTLDNDDDDDDASSYTCGMAFCYLGCTLEAGRFWYLEDLFIEESYRGKGAGTFIMQTLASIGLSLDCARLVWQALDWNTPALTFYSKLGAEVVDGLLTTRFMGGDLKQFAASSSLAGDDPESLLPN